MVTRDAVENVLRTINDPELGIDIVSLGLIYEILVREQAVEVLMTMTTPFCPLDAFFQNIVPQRLREAFPELTAANIRFTFEPPWTQERIRPEARLALGLKIAPPPPR